jgi:flavin-dependent dehydrogenase
MVEISNLDSFDEGALFEADVVIIGGGPAGLTIAREFFGKSTQVLVLESGLMEENPIHAALAEVESIGEPRSDLQRDRRIAFHGTNASTW